jgi:hypothetical protein
MNKLINNSGNLGVNEPANYTLVSTETLQNTFPRTPTEEPGLRLKERGIKTPGKSNRKTSASVARKTRT